MTISLDTWNRLSPIGKWIALAMGARPPVLKPYASKWRRS